VNKNATSFSGGGTWELSDDKRFIHLVWDPMKVASTRSASQVENEQGQRTKGKTDSLRIETKTTFSSLLGTYERKLL